MSRSRLALTLIAAVTFGFIILMIVVAVNDEDKPPPVIVKVDGPDADSDTDRVLTVPQADLTEARSGAPDIGTKDETPPGAPVGDLDAAKRAADEVRRTKLPLPVAGATAGFAGCRSTFVANQSSRRGVRPTMQTAHYTVSPNRPGWSDVNAIIGLFDRPSSQASSHFVIDSEGHCAYIVPIEAKAWTQAAGNPFSVSYEIVATGKEAKYLAPAGMAKLTAVTREVARRTGIPLRRGRVAGCAPTRTGIVEHRDWGLCGGGHVDISPFPINSIVAQITSGAKPLTASQRKACDLLNFHRKRAHEIGRWYPSRAARAKMLEKQIPAGRCPNRYRS